MRSLEFSALSFSENRALQRYKLGPQNGITLNHALLLQALSLNSADYWRRVPYKWNRSQFISGRIKTS